MIRLRLRRIGKKGRAYYRVVAADARAPRDGGFIEELGAYNPHADPPVANLNEERVQYWLSVGAQPSEPVERLLKRRGLLAGPNDPPPGAMAAIAAAKSSATAVAEAPAEAPAAAPAPAAEAPAEPAAAEAPSEESEADAGAEAPVAEAEEAPSASAEAEDAPAGEETSAGDEEKTEA